MIFTFPSIVFHLSWNDFDGAKAFYLLCFFSLVYIYLSYLHLVHISTMETLCRDYSHEITLPLILGPPPPHLFSQSGMCTKALCLSLILLYPLKNKVIMGKEWGGRGKTKRGLMKFSFAILIFGYSRYSVHRMSFMFKALYSKCWYPRWRVCIMYRVILHGQ